MQCLQFPGPNIAAQFEQEFLDTVREAAKRSERELIIAEMRGGMPYNSNDAYMYGSNLFYAIRPLVDLIPAQHKDSAQKLTIDTRPVLPDQSQRPVVTRWHADPRNTIFTCDVLPPKTLREKNRHLQQQPSPGIEVAICDLQSMSDDQLDELGLEVVPNVARDVLLLGKCIHIPAINDTPNTIDRISIDIQFG